MVYVISRLGAVETEKRADDHNDDNGDDGDDEPEHVDVCLAGLRAQRVDVCVCVCASLFMFITDIPLRQARHI